MARRKYQVEPAKDTRFKENHEFLPPKDPGAKKIVRYSLLEARQQINDVEHLLLRGASDSQIIRAMKAHAKVPCSTSRTRKLIQRIRDQWASEDQGMRASWKSAAIRRITQHIENAKGEVADDGSYRNANFAAIARFESELASIQGTHEPIEVKMDLQVSQAVAHAIVQMTPEQVQRALADMQAMERAAELWNSTQAAKQLPAQTG